MSQNLLLTSIRQIVQIVNDASTEFLAGNAMKDIKVLTSDDSDLHVLCTDGKIASITQGAQPPITPPGTQILDCQNGVILPGFVDGHSHPVFAGDRVHEFAMKLAGATYMEVQAAGGGIHFTTTKTREASEEELYANAKSVLDQMLASGTTTLEAKTGYGLDWASELKLARVIDRLANNHEIEVSGTFCAAHAVPRGASEAGQTRLIVDEMIPTLARLQTAGELRAIENVDVFCEKGVFELESSKEILQAGKSIGLSINFHGDELHPLGGAELGAELGARAVAHLEEISDAGIVALAAKGTVATLLPSTAFMLRLQPPPARKLVAQGAIIALGSDFNPNAYCLAMPTIMHLACVVLRLSMPEALVAATLNAAHSLGRGKTHGAVAVGRVADVVVLRAPRWEHVIYRLAGHSALIHSVIKSGKIAFSAV